MRLEISDNLAVPANDLVRHYDDIRKRLMRVHNEVASAPIAEIPADSPPTLPEVVDAVESAADIANRIVFFPSRPVFDQFRALAIQCGLREPTMAAILYEVRTFYGLDHHAIMAHRRTKDVVRPRQIAYYLCRELTTRSLPDIGRFFKNRDHTTILHGVRAIEARRKTNERLADEIDVLKLRISEGLA